MGQSFSINVDEGEHNEIAILKKLASHETKEVELLKYSSSFKNYLIILIESVLSSFVIRITV